MKTFKPFLVAAVVLLAATLPASATIHIVNCGSPANTVSTLISSGTATSGDTIVVEPCATPYNGITINGLVNFHIVMADRSFLGASPEGVGAGMTPAAIFENPGGACVTIQNSTDVSILGFQIQNCGTYGVHAVNSQHVTLEGNVVDGTGNEGLYSDNNFNSRFSGNQIQNTGGTGIWLVDTIEALINDNEILKTGNHGIQVQDRFTGGGWVKVYNNLVDTTAGDGIEINSGHDHQVQRNTVTGASGAELECVLGAAAIEFVGNVALTANFCGALIY